MPQKGDRKSPLTGEYVPPDVYEQHVAQVLVEETADASHEEESAGLPEEETSGTNTYAHDPVPDEAGEGADAEPPQEQKYIDSIVYMAQVAQQQIMAYRLVRGQPTTTWDKMSEADRDELCEQVLAIVEHPGKTLEDDPKFEELAEDDQIESYLFWQTVHSMMAKEYGRTMGAAMEDLRPEDVGIPIRQYHVYPNIRVDAMESVLNAIERKVTHNMRHRVHGMQFNNDGVHVTIVEECHVPENELPEFVEGVDDDPLLLAMAGRDKPNTDNLPPSAFHDGPINSKGQTIGYRKPGSTGKLGI